MFRSTRGGVSVTAMVGGEGCDWLRGRSSMEVDRLGLEVGTLRIGV